MYRLTGRKELRRKGEVISPGEEFEPSDAELRSFGDKLEKVDSEPDDAHDDTEESDSEETDEVYTCAGKDGECSREVDGPGQYCWQHTPS